jgi:putative spermidine/putrescine transport system substrate-binding protein
LTILGNVRGVAGLVLALAIVAAACDGSGPRPPAPSSAPSARPSAGAASDGPPGSPDALTDLVTAAEAEGTLTTIGLAHEWCGYGEVLKTFTSRYAITVNELNPDATFSDQLAAVKANRETKGPEAPDVIDVGMSFGEAARAEGLLAPFKVSTWATIPAAVKNPEGFWYGDYYGVLVFETNRSAGATPPADWADLLASSRSGKFALAGDPRVSTQAIETVYAAALANGGSLDDAAPGLAFFAKVNKAENLLPTIATQTRIADGSTPVSVRWTYSALAHRDVAAGSPEIEVTVPVTGRLAGASVQAISAFAPHPNAARLWIEFLYSDEVQNIWLQAHCFPARLDDLLARGAVTPEIVANLPDIEGAVFPTLKQLNAASNLITQKWNAVVGVDVK